MYTNIVAAKSFLEATIFLTMCSVVLFAMRICLIHPHLLLHFPHLRIQVIDLDVMAFGVFSCE